MQTTGTMLPRAHIQVPLEAATLDEAVLALIRHLHALGALRDADEAERVVRETGLRDTLVIKDLVALPHVRTDAVDRMLVALGVAPQPLDTRGTGVDAGPRIVILVLAPADTATAHLPTIAALARVLRQDGVIDAILAARSPDDILAIEALRDLELLPRLAVRDVMRYDPPFVGPDATVREVVDVLTRGRMRAVPVVGEKHEVLGIASERDIMRAIIPQLPRGGEADSTTPTSPTRVRVRDLMTRSVLCVSEDLSLDEAANMMVNKDVDLFPVVSEGRLVGVITRRDIIRALFMS